MMILLNTNISGFSLREALLHRRYCKSRERYYCDRKNVPTMKTVFLRAGGK
jgi:hypothetical protein